MTLSHLIERALSELSFAGRQSALKKKKKNHTDLRQNYAFCDDIPSRDKKKNADAKMQSHPKSATAENNLLNTSYYTIQKR